LSSGFVRTLRYVHSWTAGAGVTRQDIEITRDGQTLPASFVRPCDAREPLAGWIMLGGLTRMGRLHPQLVRFADSVAASGIAVIVPEIPEWQDLRLAPRVTLSTILAAADALDRLADVRTGPYALSGVSFGAPQAAMAANTPDLAGRISEVVCFGGYCDLERTLRCQLTGVHEWQGTSYALDPDPYGRWVLAANYLTDVPGYEDAAEIAEGLRRLALASTGLRIPAWDARHDPLKHEIRTRMNRHHQATFDLLAPRTGVALTGGPVADRLAIGLTAACRRAEPLLDPQPHLGRMRVPIHLFHGRGDRVVPFTESLRFRRALPDTLSAHVTITDLFAHSADSKPGTLANRVRERLIFFRAMQRVLGSLA
jgi:dienelactone hydrolase